jgi:hypothetical protein
LVATGLQYRAIQYGPVPHNYEVLYALAAQNDIIQVETTEIHDKIGEQFLPLSTTIYNGLNDTDTAHLQHIVALFKDKTSSQISAQTATKN